jgi:hypothetical protein
VHDSRKRRAAHDDDRLRVFIEASETLQLRSSDQESTNSSNKYLMIGQSTTFNAATLRQAARNLNPDFSMVRPHTIIDSMQRLSPKGHPSLSWTIKGPN